MVRCAIPSPGSASFPQWSGAEAETVDAAHTAAVFRTLMRMVDVRFRFR